MLKYVLALILLASPASALTINPTWDTSVTSGPQSAQFQGAVNKAIAYLQGNYFNPVTVNIKFGFGAINGVPCSSLGTSYTYWNGGYTPSQMLAWLKASATSQDDATAYANWPATFAPSLGYWLSTAVQKAFGIRSASTAVDGNVCLSSAYAMTFDNSGGVAPGMYDLTGVALHEITEVMGRSSSAGSDGASVLDAFRYLNGVFSHAWGGSFSIDGGQTSLQTFSLSSDSGDWGNNIPNDPVNAYVTSGVVLVFSQPDLVAVDVIGWSRASVPPPPVPAPPTGLSATPGSQRHGHTVNYFVSLAWSQSGATGDQVWRSVNGGGFTLLRTISGATGYTDSAVVHGSSYVYYVVATNTAGASPPSTTAGAVP